MSNMSVDALARATGTALEDLARNSSLHDLNQPEEQLDRYVLWAKEAGVAASGSHNIDYKLRRNNDVRMMVTQLLEAIKANVVIAQEKVTELQHPSEDPHIPSIDGVLSNPTNSTPPIPDVEAGATRLASLDDNAPSSTAERSSSNAGRRQEREQSTFSNARNDVSKRDQPNTTHAVIDAACFAVGDSITRLIRLSRMIKRHQNKKTNVTADQYSPKDENGKVQTSEFATYVKWLLESHPQLRLQKEVLRDRLQSTMVKRWRRASYYTAKTIAAKPRHNASSLNVPPMRAGRSHDMPAAQDELADHSRLTRQFSFLLTTEKSPERPPTIIMLSEPSTSNAPSLDSAFKPQDDQQSTTSQLRLKSLAGTKASEFPVPPKTIAGSLEFMCPFCGSLQPASILEDKAWRLHVSHDLAPYICLYEQCSLPEELYGTSKEWLAHMESHRQNTWLCRQCHRNFYSKAAFSDHLCTEHEVTVSSQELKLLIGLSHSPIGFTECQLCNLKLDEVDDLNNHIAEHLRQLSLCCTPWNLDTRAESDDAMAQAASVGALSSQIRMYEFVRQVDLDIEQTDMQESSATHAHYLNTIQSVCVLDQRMQHGIIERWRDQVKAEAQKERNENSWKRNVGRNKFDTWGVSDAVTEGWNEDFDFHDVEPQHDMKLVKQERHAARGLDEAFDKEIERLHSVYGSQVEIPLPLRTSDVSKSGQIADGTVFGHDHPTTLQSTLDVSAAGTPAPAADPEDLVVLFICASLYEFTIDKSRREAGYPYLTYGTGEIFDVLSVNGELWLARNQDDRSGTLGWIWEQHFVKLDIPEDAIADDANRAVLDSRTSANLQDKGRLSREPSGGKLLTSSPPASYFMAHSNFVARSADELDLKRGDRLELIERDDVYGDGWWLGRMLESQQIGLFPAVYVAPEPPPFSNIPRSMATSMPSESTHTSRTEQDNKVIGSVPPEDINSYVERIDKRQEDGATRLTSQSLEPKPQQHNAPLDARLSSDTMNIPTDPSGSKKTRSFNRFFTSPARALARLTAPNDAATRTGDDRSPYLLTRKEASSPRQRKPAPALTPNSDVERLTISTDRERSTELPIVSSSRTPAPNMKQYEADALLPGYIRLFSMRLASRTSDPIEGAIYIVDLETSKKLKYEALSYAWEYTDRPVERITVNGKPMSLRANLVEALRSLRDDDKLRLRVLWADDICINMDDMEERSQQIALMPQIFVNATSVVAWLGSGDPSMVNEMFQLANNQSRAPRPTTGKILTSALLTRRWVVQELALARSISVRYGNVSVDWNHFFTVVTDLSKQSSQLLRESSRHVYAYTKRFEWLRMLKQIVADSFTRDEHGTALSPRYSLVTLVAELKYFNVSIAHDAIYSLRSMSEEAWELSTALAPPVPDYTLSADQVYADFVEWSIERTGNIDIICRGWVPQDSYTSAAKSWQRPVGKRSFTEFNILSSENQTLLQPSYSAGTFHMAADPVDWFNHWVIDGDELQGAGAYLGRITALSEVIFGGVIAPEVMTILGSSVSEKGMFFSANRTAQGTHIPSIWDTVADLMLSFLDEGKPLVCSDYFHDGQTGDFAIRMADVVNGRRIIRLGSGSVGIAEADVQIGDAVYLLCRCSVPCILRSKDGRSVELIGDAYIHKYMDPRLFAPGELLYESVVIC